MDYSVGNFMQFGVTRLKRHGFVLLPQKEVPAGERVLEVVRVYRAAKTEWQPITSVTFRTKMRGINLKS